jgi:hypothetical protein
MQYSSFGHPLFLPCSLEDHQVPQKIVSTTGKRSARDKRNFGKEGSVAMHAFVLNPEKNDSIALFFI